MFLNYIKKHSKKIVIALLIICLIIFTIGLFINSSLLTWIGTCGLGLFSTILIFIKTPREDRLLLIITLLILAAVSALLYYEIDSFEDIIILAFTLIVDIIITELFDIKEKTIKAKIEISGYKDKINDSYIELYYNYKKAIVRIFIFSLALLIIIFNSIIKINNYISNLNNSNRTSGIFMLTSIVFGVSVLIASFVIEFILKHNNKANLFSIRKQRNKYPDVEEEIQHFLGEYTEEEIDILEGKYNYHTNIREIRERIYVLINKEAYEKNNNKPNAIKELDNILGQKEYNDSYDKIIEYLEKIRKKIKKNQDEKETIESINRCIKELNILKKEKNNVRTISR